MAALAVVVVAGAPAPALGVVAAAAAAVVVQEMAKKVGKVVTLDHVGPPLVTRPSVMSSFGIRGNDKRHSIM